MGGKELHVYEMDEHHEAVLSNSVAAAVRERAGGVLVNFDSHDDLGISNYFKKRQHAAALASSISPLRDKVTTTSTVTTTTPPARRSKRKAKKVCYKDVQKLKNKRQQQQQLNKDLNIPVQDALRKYLETQNRRALGYLEIGTWIMPLVALGAYGTIIWITKWANVPKGSFEALVGYRDLEGNHLLVTGDGVPNLWRALWGEAYHKECPVGLALKNVRIVVVDIADAASMLRLYRGSRWTISVDLDFFTVANPGKAALPELHGDRDLKSDLWELASAVPIERGIELYDTLLCYYTGKISIVKATSQLIECASGTLWQVNGSRTFNRSEVDSLLRRSFGRITKQWLTLLCASSHLAEHHASAEELEVLYSDFKECITTILHKRGIDPPSEILVARSENYRHDGYHKRQEAQKIRDTVVAMLKEPVW